MEEKLGIIRHSMTVRRAQTARARAAVSVAVAAGVEAMAGAGGRGKRWQRRGAFA